MKTASRNKIRAHRKRRIRAKVAGTDVRPRLCVFRSLRCLYVQVIDDSLGKTLVSATTKEGTKKNKKFDMNAAREAGKLIAKKCKAKEISEVVFDRGGYKYHGKVKAVAEGAREGGLIF